jgi:hypothetical protein
LLVKARYLDPVLIEAVAFTFFRVCPTPLDYVVRGSVDPAGVLVLVGPAPIITPWCVILGLDWTEDSELRFVPTAGAAAAVDLVMPAANRKTTK